MITGDQLNTIEDCLTNALQKVRRARDVIGSARRFTDNRESYPETVVREAEGAHVYAETMMLGALDELDDEIDKLPKHRQRNAS